MAKLSIVKEDNAVAVDGFGVNNEDISSLASNIRALQWDSTTNTGHIEYTDGTENADITSISSEVQALIPSVQAKKVTHDNARATLAASFQAEEDAETALMATPQGKRSREYPPLGDQLDSLYHAGVFDATMTASIKAIKDKYPK
tara:strand:+ start:58 stop:492 length:435 start_codon:yes stop_codon:yes gene_type:complete